LVKGSNEVAIVRLFPSAGPGFVVPTTLFDQRTQINIVQSFQQKIAVVNRVIEDERSVHLSSCLDLLRATQGVPPTRKSIENPTSDPANPKRPLDRRLKR
jgi:hypothetical protein